MEAKKHSTLEKYAQVISAELMQALKAAAEARGVSLDFEIASRLMVGLSEPNFNKDVSRFNQIMRQQFSHADAVTECRLKRKAALYNYEIEKLRLFLRFEKNLPKRIKESFVLIDVKTATKEIQVEIEAEIEAQEKANRQD